MKLGKAEVIYAYIKKEITNNVEIIEIIIDDIKYKGVAVFNNIKTLEKTISKKFKNLDFYKMNKCFMDDWGEDYVVNFHTIGKELTGDFEAIVILDKNKLYVEKGYRKEIDGYNIVIF